MDKIVIPAVFIPAGIIGLFLGIILGSFLGRVGSLQILSFILRIPNVLIKSPKKLESKWKMWRELRDLRKIECLKRQRKIKESKGEIDNHKKEIKRIKTRIRQVKWEFREPKER